MNLKSKDLLIGAIIGILLTLLISSYIVNTQNFQAMKMVGMGRGVEHMMDEEDEDKMMSVMHGDEEMSMNDMVKGLENLSGAEFDREFVRLMIEHHEGAIGMAQLIPEKSEREELRRMGEDIINVQSKEIEMMNEWLSEWSEK